MTSNSPMIRRVKHGLSPGIVPSLPRKGRIRVVLALLLIVCIVRIGPPLVRRFELPAPVSARDTAPESPQPQGGIPPASLDTRKTTDLSRLLVLNPDSYTKGSSVVFDGNDSLTLYTSIDSSLQRSMTRLVSRYHPLYGALIALHPASGRVLALVSYTNDSMPELGGNLCFRSIFPAASVYKTITAAAAVERAGFSAACSVEHRGRSHTLYHSQIAPTLDWSVELTFAQAYARSINAVFARIGIYEIGGGELFNISNRFGFNQAIPGELICDVSRLMIPDSTFGLAELASGFNQETTISPLHGALIAAAVAEKGLIPVPSLVDSVVRTGEHRPRYEHYAHSWLNPVRASTAMELQKMMRSVVTVGTAAKQFRTLRKSRWFDEFTYGGKTGSVDKDGIGRVDWFIGFATHPQNPDERIAVGAVTAHGTYWTVHSSYLAAEAIRMYLKNLREQKRLQESTVDAASADSSSS